MHSHCLLCIRPQLSAELIEEPEEAELTIYRLVL